MEHAMIPLERTPGLQRSYVPSSRSTRGYNMVGVAVEVLSPLERLASIQRASHKLVLMVMFVARKGAAKPVRHGQIFEC